MDRERHGGWATIMANRHHGTIHAGETAGLPARIMRHRFDAGSVILHFERKFGNAMLDARRCHNFRQTIDVLLMCPLSEYVRVGMLRAYPVQADTHYMLGASSRRNRVQRRSVPRFRLRFLAMSGTH